MADNRRLRRSDNRMIAGVCAGLAEYFEIPVTRFRIAYVAFSVLSAAFPGFALYLVLWFLLPTGDPKP